MQKYMKLIKIITDPTDKLYSEYLWIICFLIILQIHKLIYNKTPSSWIHLPGTLTIVRDYKLLVWIGTLQ